MMLQEISQRKTRASSYYLYVELKTNKQILLTHRNKRVEKLPEAWRWGEKEVGKRT